VADAEPIGAAIYITLREYVAFNYIPRRLAIRQSVLRGPIAM